MPIIINELTSEIGGYSSVGVSFCICTKGEEKLSERYLNKIYIVEPESSGNYGRWCANNNWINLLAWSAQGTFKRINHSLYFYSDEPHKPNSSLADFVFHYAPATAYDYLANRDALSFSGEGKIINPRNPSWAGLAIAWRQTFDSGISEN